MLTDNCIYILDIDKREIIFQEPQTQYQDIVTTPTDDKFLVHDYYQIGLLDKEFNFQVIETDYDMDDIKFDKYEDFKLNIELEKVSDYIKVKGYVDTRNWTIVTE